MQASTSQAIQNLCNDDNACVVNPYMQNVGTNSLTSLGSYEGAFANDEATTYGSEFAEVEYNPPYYERMIKGVFIRPWLGQNMERTFMNRTKVLNEPPVKTYRELLFAPIPQEKYETVEGFGPKDNTGILLHVIVVLICFAILLRIFHR